MLENVKKYKTSVEIVSGSIFENAEIFTDLAITTLQKIKDNFGKLDKYIWVVLLRTT
jgi:predicted HTH domain antitoxin